MKSNMFVWALAGALAIGCSNDKKANEAETAASLSPKPAQEQSLSAKLDRYLGQTQFLNIEHSFHPHAASRSLESADSKGLGGGARQEQESDVFKVGTAGSKLLYLLNPSRGLQVVSFADGAQAPKILGRANPTGNHAEQMYSDNERGRMVAIEHYYKDNKSGSRLVVYDVKNPARPVVKQVVDAGARIVDSRIVGDVLYVAIHDTTEQHSRWGWSHETVSGGRVVSYNLKAAELVEVQSVKLQLPAAHGELMNIQTTGTGKDMKYYLIAVQSESGWIWWDRASAVEIIDITDPHGKIAPMMTVLSKGRISERSQTKIHGNHLIVTSNYVVNPDARENRIARISVESFRLADAKPDVISQDEAEYRRLHIERAVNKASEAEREAVREQMLADKDLGLKGRFVTQKNGSLKKLVADAVVTSGDTKGLSASLQDVRYQGDLLYAFWVPATNVDPLDVFNLSDLEKGIKYEGRLEFDGWISRSFPVTYKGRRFILGLGWEIQNVNNETQRRYPQAKIFEIKDATRKVRGNDGLVREEPTLQIVDVPGAKVAMTEAQHVWANFNGNDREIELRMDTDGAGEILFSAYKWSREGGSTEGGQLIRFNLEDVVQGIEGQAVQVGPFLAAPHGWLRRTFTNSEIKMVNAFSTQALSTFDTAQVKASQTARAVSVLELARDISDYRVLPTAKGLLGIQIIRSGGYYDSNTVLRVVDPKFADAEKTAVKSEVTLPGSVAETIATENGKALLMLTSKTAYTQEKTDTTYVLARVQLNDKGELALDQISWVETVEHQSQNRRGGRDFIGRGWRQYSSASLTPVDGRVIVKSGQKVQVIEEGKALAPVALTATACPEAEIGVNVEMKKLDGQLVYLTTKEERQDDQEHGFASKHIAMATIDGQQLKCGKSVNIPGNPVMLNGKYLVTSDSFAKDVRLVTEVVQDHEGKKREYKRLQSIGMNAYTLVELGSTEARLLDQTTELNGRYGLQTPVRLAGEGSLLFIGSENDDNQYGVAKLNELLIQNKRLTVATFQLDGAEGYVSLLGSAKKSKTGERVLVLTSNDGVRVYSMPVGGRPVSSKFKPVLEDGSLGESVESYMSSAYGTVHFTESQNSVEISSGLRGIVQLNL